MKFDARLDPKTGAARILDVSPRAAEHFSKRSQDIEKAAGLYAAAEGYDWETMTGAHKVKFLRRGVEETRQAKRDHDGDSDFTSWRRQAEDEIGYYHRSVLRPGQEQGLRRDVERHRMAYEVQPAADRGSPLWQGQAGRSGLSGIRCAGGLVEAGIGDDPAADIKTIMTMYR